MREQHTKRIKEKNSNSDIVSLFTKIFTGSLLILFVGFVMYALLFVLMYYI